MTYTFVINSTERLSGTANNGTYNVNFRILPRDIKYFRVTFSFYTKSSYYRDVIAANNTITYTCGNGYIYTTLVAPKSVETDGSPTTILGFWQKQAVPTDINAHPYLNYLYSGIENTSVPLTVLRPVNENISIGIFPLCSLTPVVDTDHAGVLLSDMTDWVLTLNFEPVLNVDTE
jgi:hypothetical protein